MWSLAIAIEPITYLKARSHIVVVIYKLLISMLDRIEELLQDGKLTEDQKMALKTVAARADDYSLVELGAQLKAYNVR